MKGASLRIQPLLSIFVTKCNDAVLLALVEVFRDKAGRSVGQAAQAKGIDRHFLGK
jgi:hypothetical protein